MARLQVLYLPSTDTSRFALVVDMADQMPAADKEALRSFATQIGTAVVILSGSLDVDHGDDDDATAEELGESLRDLFTAHTAAAQPAKLPPPDTPEGKLARVWGGRKPDLEDPR